MMTKEQAAQALTDAGFPAAVEDGVIMIKNPVSKKDQQRVKKTMKEIRYSGSCGWRKKT